MMPTFADTSETDMSNSLMQQFVAGLKSRHADVRFKAAGDLYHYVSHVFNVRVDIL